MTSLAEAQYEIVEAGRWLDARGWAPATAGNYSVRLDDGRIAITVSGRHKGRLVEGDVMTVDAMGQPLDGKKPSAETWLHCAIYRDFPQTNAVLHAHSPVSVGFTRAFPALAALELAGHEMLKVLPGIATHDSRVAIPIVDNSQDMAEIDALIASRLRAPGAPPAYLIRGHGLYGWGADMAGARNVIEAIEWLVEAERAEAQFRGAGG